MQHKLRTDLEKACEILYMENLAEDTVRGCVPLGSEGDRLEREMFLAGFFNRKS